MRISFFLPRCTTEKSHGRYVIEFARRLVFENEIAVTSGAFWPPVRSTLRCHWAPVPNRPALARISILWAASLPASKMRRSDIVHIQGADAPVGNVVTAHCCNAAMQAAVQGRGTLIRRFNYWVGERAEGFCFTKRSTLSIIAVSQKVKEEIESYYEVDPARVTVIPHGVDAERFNPRNRDHSRTRVRSELGIEQEAFLAIYVGGDYRLKGFEQLL